jgi:hypothetical protein
MRPVIRSEAGAGAVAPRLALLFAVALIVRLAGVAFGLPELFHPDEPTSIGEALGLIRGAPDALSFANPPLYKYVLVGAFDVLIGQQRLADVDASGLYLIARAASAVFGALTVFAVFWMGHVLRGPQVGLIAAGIAAVTYMLVRESHFGVNDALATLCTTAALAACVRVACRGTRLDYVVAGALVGVAFASKYQCAALAVPWLLAHVQHGRRRRDVDLLIGVGVAAVAAVIACPPLVTETRRLVGDVYVFLVLPSRLGFEGLDPAGAYVYYLKSFGWGIGWPLLVLGCIGGVRAVMHRDWPLLVVASLPISLYAVMGSSHMYVARFQLPGIPSLIVLAAVVLYDIGRASWVVSVGLAAAVLVGTVPATVQFDTLLTREDTRTAARDWIQSNIPRSAHVLADPPAIGPPLANLGLDVREPEGPAEYDAALSDYRAQGIQYIVTSSFSADAPDLDPARNARRQAFYAALMQQAEEIAEFRPDTGSDPTFVYDRIYGPWDSLDQFDVPGPTIRVFRLSSASES